jgi:hypothetical protein
VESWRRARGRDPPEERPAREAKLVGAPLIAGLEEPRDKIPATQISALFGCTIPDRGAVANLVDQPVWKQARSIWEHLFG